MVRLLKTAERAEGSKLSVRRVGSTWSWRESRGIRAGQVKLTIPRIITRTDKRKKNGLIINNNTNFRKWGTIYGIIF